MSAPAGPMYGVIARLATLAEARQAQYADAASQAKTNRGRAINNARSAYYFRLRTRLEDALAIAPRQGVTS